LLDDVEDIDMKIINILIVFSFGTKIITNMKKSMYNSYLTIEKNSVIFNSDSKEFLFLNDTLKLLFDKCNDNKDFENLKEIHEDFFNILVRKNFIVNKHKNEYEIAKENWLEIQQRDRKYELHINPTLNCNFSCWYCFETHQKKSLMSIDIQNRICALVDNIISQNSNFKYFDVKWFGGEPLLVYKDAVADLFDNIYNIVKKKNNNIIFRSYITTNGFLINEKIIEQFKKYNVQEFQITLDGHRERHNKVRFISKNRGSYDDIVNNIKSIIHNKLKVRVRINCSKETIDNIEKISDDFINVPKHLKKYIIFDFHEIWQIEENLEGILFPIRNIFREKGFKVVNTNINVFEYVCYADRKYNSCVNYNGDVFKCTARDFTQENREGVLSENGTIQWNDKLLFRNKSKFKNKPCETCKIFPICGAGCSQKAMENIGKNYCIYNFDENLKDRTIIEYFQNCLNDKVVI
jgi:uncharacterized protein